MTSEEKIRELRGIIEREVSPLITDDYVLWGLPYHSNIGDTLIWEGELNFLKTIPHKCLDVCAWDGYRHKPLKKNTIILLHGGGYFGDTWRNGWEYPLDCIENYPENRIVLFPNTIYYEDKALMAEDARRMAKLKNLVICARDKVSYQIAKENFSNEVRLVPDMAFCISLHYLSKWRKPSNGRTLFLKRIDKELGKGNVEINGKDIDVRDWPTMDSKPHWQDHAFSLSMRVKNRLSRHLPALSAVGERLEDWTAYHIYRPHLTRMGVEFVSPYKDIVTTRLHVMILATLLGQKVEFVDNSYGKLSSFYNSWLSDADNVQPYKGSETKA